MTFNHYYVGSSPTDLNYVVSGHKLMVDPSSSKRSVPIRIRLAAHKFKGLVFQLVESFFVKKEYAGSNPV